MKLFYASDLHIEYEANHVLVLDGVYFYRDIQADMDYFLASAYCWITWYGHHVLVPSYEDRPRCWRRWGRLYLLYLAVDLDKSHAKLFKTAS